MLHSKRGANPLLFSLRLKPRPIDIQLWSSKLRPAWKPCTAQLNKATLNLIKVGHTDSCRGSDHEHIIKTYETVQLSSVRYCTRTCFPFGF